MPQNDFLIIRKNAGGQWLEKIVAAVPSTVLALDDEGEVELLLSSTLGRALLSAADEAAARLALDTLSVAEITAQINAVIDAAPGALNTLNELAAALGDDANFAATVNASIATKAASGVNADITRLTNLAPGSGASLAIKSSGGDTGIHFGGTGSSLTLRQSANDVLGLQSADVNILRAATNIVFPNTWTGSILRVGAGSIKFTASATEMRDITGFSRLSIVSGGGNLGGDWQYGNEPGYAETGTKVATAHFVYDKARRDVFFQGRKYLTHTVDEVPATAPSITFMPSVDFLAGLTAADGWQIVFTITGGSGGTISLELDVNDDGVTGGFTAVPSSACASGDAFSAWCATNLPLLNANFSCVDNGADSMTVAANETGSGILLDVTTMGPGSGPFTAMGDDGVAGLDGIEEVFLDYGWPFGYSGTATPLLDDIWLCWDGGGITFMPDVEIGYLTDTDVFFPIAAITAAMFTAVGANKWFCPTRDHTLWNFVEDFGEEWDGRRMLSGGYEPAISRLVMRWHDRAPHVDGNAVIQCFARGRMGQHWE